MEEYNIWKKIFDSDDEITLEALVELVVRDENARDLVVDNIMKFKKLPQQIVKVNINIDKELENLPIEELLAQVSKDVVKQMK